MGMVHWPELFVVPVGYVVAPRVMTTVAPAVGAEEQPLTVGLMNPHVVPGPDPPHSHPQPGLDLLNPATALPP